MPGQLTDEDVPLLGKHRLLRDLTFQDRQLRGGHLRSGYSSPEQVATCRWVATRASTEAQYESMR